MNSEAKESCISSFVLSYLPPTTMLSMKSYPGTTFSSRRIAVVLILASLLAIFAARDSMAADALRFEKTVFGCQTCKKAVH